MAKTTQTDDGARVAEVTEIVNQLRTDFEQRNKLYDYIDQILFREYPLNVPEAYKKTAQEVRSPLPTHIANTITAALSINAPLVQFEPTGFGDSYQQNATLREHFFEASWKRQEEEAKRRLFRLFMYSLITKGEGILKTVERSKRAWASYDQYSKNLRSQLDSTPGLDSDSRDRIFNAKTEEYKRGQPYPIASTDVPPRNFFYLKTLDGFSVCAEVSEIPYYDAFARYDAGIDGNGRVVPQAAGLPYASATEALKKHKNLLLVEFWKWDRCDYILCGPGDIRGGKIGSGHLIKSIQHGYGDPYTKTLRGPYFHAQGITTDHRLPEKSGLSVIYGFLDLFPYMDSLLTIQSNAAYLTGYPAFKRQQPPGASLPPGPFGNDGADEDEAEEQVVPGTIYPFDVGPIEQPQTGQDLGQAIALAKQMLDLALPAVVQGAIDSSDSGYALNQGIHQASLAWDPIVDNAEFALAERVGFESWLIENRIGENVYVWGQETPKPGSKRNGSRNGWLGIGPDDLNGVHRYKVRLDPKTPSNRVIEVRTHQELLAGRLETWDDAVTELGGNPDEVERGWLLHDLKQDPAIQAKLKERVFQQLATIDQQNLAPQVAAVNAAGGSPTGLPPGATGFGNVGQVFQPGQGGQPLTPTPAGSVSGVGPGGPPGLPPGMAPTPPMPPPTNQPLPGQ